MKTAVVVITLLLAALILGGCASDQGVEKRAIFIGADITGSNTESEKNVSKGIAEEIVDRERGQARILIYRFAHQSEKLYEDLPRDSQGMWSTVDNDVVASKAAEKKTYWAPMLNEICRKAASYDKPFGVILLTDGECHDSKATTKAAAKLAENKKLSVVLVAPVINQSGIRSKIEATLEPLGNKLVISGLDDRGFGIQKFREMEIR